MISLIALTTILCLLVNINKCSDVTHADDLSYYSRKYSMGGCVSALNEYHDRNPGKKLQDFVVIMHGVKEGQSYDGYLTALRFNETFKAMGYNPATHVFAVDLSNFRVIDPLFGKECNDIIEYIENVLMNAITIPDGYKEVTVDCQNFDEKRRRSGYSAYVMDPNIPQNSFVYDIRRKKVTKEL